MASSRTDIITSFVKNRKTGSPKQKQEEAHKNLKGSMTVEAALVLPMFLFAILSLAFIIEIVRLQIHIGCAAGQVSKEMAGYAYTYNKIKQGLLMKEEKEDSDNKQFNIADTLPGMFIAESRLVKLIGESFLDSSIIVNGSKGLSLIGSEILDDGKWIKLLVSYKVRLPFSPLPNAEIKLVQYSCSHAWVGYCHENYGDDANKKTVYMTEHGSRYHLSKSCKYLDIKSRYVSKENISSCRNKSGGKYYPCHRCMGKSEGYYITDYGSSYHTRKDCTAIKRNIIEKKLEDLGGSVACCKECEKQK